MRQIADAFAGKDRREAMARDDAEVMAMKRAVKMGIHHSALPALMQRARDYTERAMSVAESPIERVMMGPLILADWEGFMTFPVPVCLPNDDAPPRGDIILCPQMRFGRYRADIAILCPVKRGGSKIFFVECDGADFHQEWVRDRNRDRFLDRLGVTTIRLSGSEINSDTAGAVQTVLIAVTGWKDKQ